jgi:small nuclear ribonucleoprotein (snRNP)-like protein
MSSLMDGISNAQLYTAQIEQLRAKKGDASPEEVKATLYSIEQSFNDMLNNLISTDDDDDSNKTNPFDFLIKSNQQTLNNVNALQPELVENLDI